jgi:hypothetical protein
MIRNKRLTPTSSDLDSKARLAQAIGPTLMTVMARLSEANSTLATSLCLILLVGCQVTSSSLAQAQQADRHPRLEIIYEAHGASGAMFTPGTPELSADRDIYLVSQNSTSSVDGSSEGGWSVAELRIEYPHPAGRDGFGRASLRLKPVGCGASCGRTSFEARLGARCDQNRARFAASRERWLGQKSLTNDREHLVAELDIPAEEIDLLLVELDSHRFFAHPSIHSEGAKLEVHLNRRCTSRSWTFVPSLDEITRRVLAEDRSTVDDSGLAGSVGPGIFHELPHEFEILDPGR